MESVVLRESVLLHMFKGTGFILYFDSYFFFLFSLNDILRIQLSTQEAINHILHISHLNSRLI